LALNLYAFRIESSYDKAHQKALKEHKILLVFLTKKGCDYCNKELQKILQNKMLNALIEKKAVFAIVRQGQKESYPIEMLYTKNYPALFFLNENELFTCKTLYTLSSKEIIKCLK